MKTIVYYSEIEFEVQLCECAAQEIRMVPGILQRVQDNWIPRVRVWLENVVDIL